MASTTQAMLSLACSSSSTDSMPGAELPESRQWHFMALDQIRVCLAYLDQMKFRIAGILAAVHQLLLKVLLQTGYQALLTATS